MTDTVFAANSADDAAVDNLEYTAVADTSADDAAAIAGIDDVESSPDDNESAG